MIQINTNEQTSIAIDCFRTIINSVDGEILVADFAHEVDNYLLATTGSFAQNNGVFELTTSNSDLEYSFNMPVLVLPNTISSKASRTVVMDVKNELGESVSIEIDNVSEEIVANDNFVSYTINAYSMSGKEVRFVLQSQLSGKVSIDNIKIVLREYTEEIEDMEAAVDFIINVESGRDVRILQITDTQIIDPGQCRYPERLGGNVTPLTPEDIENGCFRYIREAIERTNPDLIIFTGDITYGEFDDNGEILTKIIEFMESFNIPWAPAFGNHDNETMKGVTWQCQQFENAKNCLFKRGEITGNGNYSIGIMQDGKLIKVVYMMDSNGCRNAYNYEYKPELGGYNQGEKIQTSQGFGADQVEWLNKKSSEIDLIAGYSVSKIIAFHIPLAEFNSAAYEKGYVTIAGRDNSELFNLTRETEDKSADFGSKDENFGSFVCDGFWDILTQNGFDGVFVGHAHKCNFSIVYQGIRVTFGLKTSTFDYHSSDMLGGTLITIENSDGDFYVEHVYHKEV